MTTLPFHCEYIPGDQPLPKNKMTAGVVCSENLQHSALVWDIPDAGLYGDLTDQDFTPAMIT